MYEKRDPEAVALDTMYSTIKDFAPQAQERMLNWLTERLRAETKRQRPPGKLATVSTGRKPHIITDEGRQRIRDAQRQRWARWHAAKAG